MYRYTLRWTRKRNENWVEVKIWILLFLFSFCSRLLRPWNFAVEWRALKKLLNKKIWLIGLVFFFCKVFLFRWCDLFWWWNLYGDFKYFNTFLYTLRWLNILIGMGSYNDHYKGNVGNVIAHDFALMFTTTRSNQNQTAKRSFVKIVFLKSIWKFRFLFTFQKFCLDQHECVRRLWFIMGNEN